MGFRELGLGGRSGRVRRRSRSPADSRLLLTVFRQGSSGTRSVSQRGGGRGGRGEGGAGGGGGGGGGTGGWRERHGGWEA
eukprot:9154683-Pyramimonas_sp.AAC.1